MNGSNEATLNSSVLVLNRLYMAVHVVNVRRAFGLLLRELAEVIHIEDGQYANYDFESWREISELQAEFKEPHEDWMRSVNFEIHVPRVHPAAALRPSAEADASGSIAATSSPATATTASTAASGSPPAN